MIRGHKAMRPNVIKPVNTSVEVHLRRVVIFACLSTPIKVNEHGGVVSNEDIAWPEITEHHVV